MTTILKTMWFLSLRSSAYSWQSKPFADNFFSDHPPVKSIAMTTEILLVGIPLLPTLAHFMMVSTKIAVFISKLISVYLQVAGGDSV